MTDIKKCPVCGVIIDEESDLPVKFSHGRPGTKEKLYARVCQYAKGKGCINNPNISHKDCVETDYYIEFEPPK